MPSEDAAVKRNRAVAVWLVAFLFQLSLVIGATSFTITRVAHNSPSPRPPPSFGADLQRQALTAFVTRTPQTEPIPGWSTRILVPLTIQGVVIVTGLSWERAFSFVRLITILVACATFVWFLLQLFNPLEA